MLCGLQAIREDQDAAHSLGINLTLYKLDKVMEGDLDEIIDALITDHQARLMADEGA